MKWCKRWSFLIMLAITGAIYYGATEGIQTISNWQYMNPIGEENPQEDTERLQDSFASGGDYQADALEESSPLESEETTFPGGVPIPVPTPEPESPSEEPEPTATPEPTAIPEPEIRIGRVEDDYFADALFLGDSRTVGLSKYGVWGETATFYATTGMTIYKLLGAEIVALPEQPDTISVEEALQHQSFGKIYIMMGINEVGSGTAESFAQTYGEVVARLQELQPDAVIYIQSILKVTQARSDKGDYINNEAIQTRNEALSQLADGEKVFYLDVNEALRDENGALNSDYTFDGVHLKAKYISLWEEFLRDNAVLLD